ncbi:MAG: ubiquinol-cytochrome c reductase iron-sulfur subunit [Pseudomonadota bacterium]
MDKGRRRFLTTTTAVVGAAGAACVAVPFIASWTPSTRARAIGAPVTVNYGKLEPGMLMRVKWRGKPVWIVRRTKEALDSLEAVKDSLRDEVSAESIQPDYAQNDYRSREPELLVLIGLCTHLGCSPTMVKASDAHSLGDDWKGGFYCPCHGSRFDFAGRVYKSVPAPTNMEVPPHHFVDGNQLVIGEDGGTA